MKIKSLAIVGLGSIGKKYLRLLKKIKPKLKIVIVRRKSSKKINLNGSLVKQVSSIKEAIKSGIQAAIISSPAPFHLKQGIQLMQSNVHILIEKPLSHDLKNTKKFLEILKKKKIVGLVGYCLRYETTLKKFKKILESKDFGNPLFVKIESISYLPNWRKNIDYRHSVSASKKLGGGVLLELSHELDYLRWLFGEVKNVYAKLTNSNTLKINVEDNAEIILKTYSGTTILVNLNFSTKSVSRKCILLGTKGLLEADLINNSLLLKKNNKKTKIQFFKKRNDLKYEKQIKHFFECIEQKKKPLVNFREGLKTLKLINAIKLSNKYNRQFVVSK